LKRQNDVHILDFLYHKPLLRELHWLRVPERITFCVCVLVYRCLHGSAPTYVAESIIMVSDVPGCRQLRLADSLTFRLPSTRCSTLGDRAFPVATAQVWNRLPISVRHAQSLHIVYRELKTILFKLSFPSV